MTILIALINISFIGFLAYREWKKLVLSDSIVYWSALSLRLIAGVCVGLVFKNYYGFGDTFTLFDYACKLVDLLYADPGAYVRTILSNGSRSEFFSSIISVVNIFTANNYWLTSLWFSFFSFCCSYRLVRKLDFVIPWSKVASRVALLFYPTVVFWSSGIVKETLAFGAVSMLAVYFLSFMRGQRITWRSLIAIGLFSFLLLNLKYYWAAVLMPSIITGLIIHYAVEKKTFNSKILISSWLAVFALLVIAVSFTHPNFYFERFLSVIVDNYGEFKQISRADNLINYYNLSPTWTSVIVNSPLALLFGLFRPTVFDASTPTAIIAGAENLLLLVLVLGKLRSLRMPMAENQLIAFTTLVYVVVLCVFLALSTPNLGTLSRYRVGFLPFFVILILVNHPILKLFNAKPSDHLRSEPPRSGGSRDL
ncbi:MAG: hypothetical protein WDO14_04615 [Bacteroidota bacterium]